MLWQCVDCCALAPDINLRRVRLQGSNPAMNELINNFNYDSPELREQLDSIGMTPDEVRRPASTRCGLPLVDDSTDNCCCKKDAAACILRMFGHQCRTPIQEASLL